MIKQSQTFGWLPTMMFSLTWLMKFCRMILNLPNSYLSWSISSGQSTFYQKIPNSNKGGLKSNWCTREKGIFRENFYFQTALDHYFFQYGRTTAGRRELGCCFRQNLRWFLGVDSNYDAEVSTYGFRHAFEVLSAAAYCYWWLSA